MLLKAPNGCVVDASESAAPKLMEQGWALIAHEQPKKKTTTRKRTIKAKE